MSSYRELKASQMNDSSCLERTLKRMGYNPVVEKNQTVRGHRAVDNQYGFDIVLKKEDTKLQGDVGFKKNADGFFTLGFDTYVIRDFTPESFVQKVTGEYVEQKARITMARMETELLEAKEVKVNGRTITRLQYRKVGA